MRITYYLRDPREGNYSIEKIFHAIGNHLNRSYQVEYFYVDKNSSYLQNLRRANECQGDINHITGDVNWLIYALNGRKTVLTVHDLGHYENTLKGSKKWIYKKIWLQAPLVRSRAVTAISHFTKKQIVSHFPKLEQSKLQVIHNPAPIPFQNNPELINSESPRILQVGGMANKNSFRLIKAVENMACTLVFIRKPDPKIEQLLKQQGTRYEFHFNLSEKQIGSLYASSHALFFASTYEGFGLPILEAQASGIPVLTSNICSMPEVAGTGACLVDPYDVNDIRQGLNRILCDTTYREYLIKEGEKNIKRFDPDRIASQYLDLYKSLM